MVFKVLKKSGIGFVMYNIISPFLQVTQEHVLDKKITLLEEISPDPKNSCYISRKKKTQPLYDLDIIVTAFNEEKYISQCIESILNQKTIFKYRLIIIDDGSTDDTAKIIDTYRQNEHTIIIHQENRGFSGSRNRGLDLINSKYLMFVDADDLLTDGAIDVLMKNAIENDADIVEGSYFYIDQEGNNIKQIKHRKKNDYRTLWGMPWGKVISSKLFSKVKFPEEYWYEDSIMHQIIYPMASNIEIIDNVVYKYRLNKEGITNRGKSKSKCVDSLWITMQLFEDRKKFSLSITNEYYEYILHMIVLTYNRVQYQPKSIQYAVFVSFADFINKNFTEYNAIHYKEKIIEKICREYNFNKLILYSKLV